MSLRRLGPWALALAGWNLFVWGGRFRNLAADPGGLAEANRWSLIGSVVFTVMALAVLAGWWLGRRQADPSVFTGWGRTVALVMAVVGILVWAYRGVSIAAADYSTGFIIVHTVLALVSIGLGGAVLWSGRGPAVVS